MNSHLTWTGGMKFHAVSDGHLVAMDAKSPIGTGTAQTPKELVAAGLGGCTAMDVVALLKKHKQSYESFELDVDIVPTTGTHPIVFQSAVVTFTLKGNIDKNILLESVKLSQTKFCGVSAMLSKAVPLTYKVILNNELIGEGKAEFSA